MSLSRLRIEWAKRVFLDRLTVDAQPLSQPNFIDAGPGIDYLYGGVYDWSDFGVGADCSGSAGIFIGAAINGLQQMSWARQFSTETFPGPFQGFRQVSQEDLLNNPYPIKVAIHHGGGGPYSHMNCEIDGWLMESNGTNGTCTRGSGAMEQDDDYWNDFWVLDGPIIEDTDWRQGPGFPRGLDYAGGRPAPQALLDAGVKFVCRYVTDGGAGLPEKRITRAEADSLRAHGIAIVSNWESYANRMREGYSAGHDDAVAALDYHVNILGGPRDGVIYYSCDYDAPEWDQPAINDYLRACGDVWGGPQHVGIYGSYYACKRARDAGVAAYTWQAEAWSGYPSAPHLDSRVHIVQRNQLGYQTVDGVSCDINESHADDFGQWGVTPTAAPIPSPVGGIVPDYAKLAYEQLMGPVQADGYGHGWEQLGGRSIVNYLTEVVAPQLYRLTRDTYVSRSSLRHLGESYTQTFIQFLLSTDANEHVSSAAELATRYGHPVEVALLLEVASAADHPDRYPDRQMDAQLAATLLTHVDPAAIVTARSWISAWLDAESAWKAAQSTP